MGYVLDALMATASVCAIYAAWRSLRVTKRIEKTASELERWIEEVENETIR